jgi:hypothetical protein
MPEKVWMWVMLAKRMIAARRRMAPVTYWRSVWALHRRVNGSFSLNVTLASLYVIGFLGGYACASTEVLFACII